uniref:Homing endonuclease LAGLIDADG domain-containing protein n=1 Tax=Orbilia brochopaga TaxID=3140254 RepID=A0A481ZQ61_9PEZI|nr:hypothetical protein [Drechslerella brochopaga]QBL02508.1 hypothetical protein [Drechslerella brochopaga]
MNLVLIIIGCILLLVLFVSNADNHKYYNYINRDINYRLGYYIRSYSTNNKNSTSIVTKQNGEQVFLKPWYVTGFCDAELCFQIQIVKSSSYRLGWKVNTQFSIHLHKKDYLALILKIQAFFSDAYSTTNRVHSYRAKWCFI